MSTKPRPEPLWTIEDLAAHLKVGLKQAYAISLRPGCPRILIGRRVRFTPGAVQAWLEQQRAS